MGRTKKGARGEGEDLAEILVAIDTAPSFRPQPESRRLLERRDGVGVSEQTESKPSRGLDGLAGKDTDDTAGDTKPIAALTVVLSAALGGCSRLEALG